MNPTILLDIILHIDKYLIGIIAQYGSLTYFILFLIIFLETGLVLTPFFPGDSLLFAAGAFAAQGAFNIYALIALLVIAAIVGDSTNYFIGHMIGERAFKKENAKFFKKEYLERTNRFYEKYGAKTIILARFVPIVRTFAPFVAGIGKMRYRKFLKYNIIGGIAWITLFLSAGYFFGNIPIIKDNFSIVILLIIFISLLPIIIELIKNRKK